MLPVPSATWEMWLEHLLVKAEAKKWSNTAFSIPLLSKSSVSFISAYIFTVAPVLCYSVAEKRVDTAVQLSIRGSFLF